MARSKQSTSKEELWRVLVKEQRRCGLSIRDFCRQKAISEPSFYAWRKKLQQGDARRTASGGSDGRLIPVDVMGSTCDNATACRDDANAPLEIGTPGGFTLRFGHDANAETIARLLDVIAQASTGGIPRSTWGTTSC